MTKPKDQFVTLETTQGNIIVKLFPEVAPKAVENFTTHVANGYYDGIIFHRIIEGFMIQGGDPTGTGRGGESIWGRPFEDEFHEDFEFDVPGLLAMANAGPRTNGSQFFITTAPTDWLNNRHTIFGKVVDGMDVVKKLEQVETDMMDRPVEQQAIKKAKIRKTPPKKK
ncbi:Peptidylprolyl isomerase [Denitrovibrio acetiphilus DSM 12809]|uniref:Peptidyl-prolyl cis-trans isomerase n=1 Tax=Denitrovibrio acetiphilus (strain DSM 12809 / NBRC 114555 / N2460) TaxID=522772 RepID=D4H6U7_DENA2|nr:peptidylprolyl isomerase [Denitrovibrio acetiphilus]ADD67813.1 Peptidylprolyl isomerase [Denitrovibrio acetiphilus DSM 12809]